ncbi:serine/threonine-protein kinase [Parashewanella tropica]|uniref:serine/threonine-protein kinase n=1 Tax=Parashewanella tropica TaxID=2547970 RepID=UPI00105A7334|nr:serine/threonine-protein kinase [Parashewanella tropica]
MERLFRTTPIGEYGIIKTEEAGKFTVTNGKKIYSVYFTEDKHVEGLWRLKKIQREDFGWRTWFKPLEYFWTKQDEHNRSIIGAAMLGWLKPNEMYDHLESHTKTEGKTPPRKKRDRYYKRTSLPADTRLKKHLVPKTEQTPEQSKFEDPLDMFKPVARPTSWEKSDFDDNPQDESVIPIMGGRKFVDNRDGQTIQLVILKGKRIFTDAEIRLNRYVLRLLSPYKSICPCVIIDRNTVLAPDGGKEVFRDVIAKHKKLSVSQFEPFCRQMMEAHHRGIYFGDIKPDNFVIANDGEPVVLIDLDSVTTFDLLKDAHVHPKVYKNQNLDRNYTLGYTTKKLVLSRDLKSLEPQDKSRMKKMNKATDEYALLLSMMESTCHRNRPIQVPFDKREHIDYFHRLTYRGILEPGNATRQCAENIRYWVENNIKPEYQSQVRLLLKDPAKNPLDVPLYRMVRW